MIDDFPSISRNWGDMPHETDSVVAIGAIANRLTERDATAISLMALGYLSFCDHHFGHDHTEGSRRGTGHAHTVDIVPTFCRPLNRWEGGQHEIHGQFQPMRRGARWCLHTLPGIDGAVLYRLVAP